VSSTIRDVARQARVSVATVSRVLNEKDTVRDETRQRVRSAVERLGYVPHGAARSLITRQTNTIGVLLPDIHGEFFSELIRGIDATVRKSGYHLLVSSSHGDRAEAGAMLRAVRGRVDGLIVLSPDVGALALPAHLSETLPVVLLNSAAAGDSFDLINIENSAGAFAMVRHLVSLGHRRIAFIKGPEANQDATERLRGYRQAVAALRPTGPKSSSLRVIFARRRGTGPAGASSRWRGAPRRSSRPTTRWPSGVSPLCARPAWTCPGISRWRDSTTFRSCGIRRRRSRPCACRSPSSAAAPPSGCSTACVRRTSTNAST
jgi:hypothetical protein